MPLTRKSFIAGAVLGVGVAGAAAAGIGLSLPQASAADPAPQLIKASTAPIFAAPPGAPQSFADIFEKVAPAVVSIDITTRVPISEMNGELPFPFNQLPQFRQGPNGPGSGRAAPGRRGDRAAPGAQGQDGDPDGEGDGAALNDKNSREAQAACSGFFISADGYIVTNNHCVENSTELRITLTDKRQLKARLIGRDPDSDIAVIKVDGGSFPYVDFENQAKPRVGDWVLAVGNPLQLGGTATAGIVSAIGRDLPADAGTLPAQYIQIDAPINRGNSGGPTFDTYGRVIGVNTAIYSQTGGSIGIGFAVPAATADQIAKDLIAGKKITRGYLGASIQPISPDNAEALGIAQNSGAYVAEVTPGGPGARAGLQAGDIVLSVDGQKIAGSAELTRAVAATRSGDIMHLQIRRGGKVMALDVKSGVRPSAAVLNKTQGAGDDDDQSPQNGPNAEANRITVLGLGVSALGPTERQKYGVAVDVKGVVITRVAEDSDAGRKGFKPGYVIVQANERPVSTPSEFAAAVADARKAGRPAVFLLINLNGRNSGVALKLNSPAPAAK